MDAVKVLKNYFQNNPMTRLLNAVLSLPVSVWVLASYLVIFFFYFILPTFLNPYHELHFFYGFPELKPLGADLHEYLNYVKNFAEKGTPYFPPNYYPPFQALFFLRFMYSGPDQSFIYLTILTYLSFIAITIIYPRLVSPDRKLNSPAIFFILTGLISYGLLFEIERGQFDLLAMAFCYLAIYIYHRHPRWRLAAYLFFVMSVNLKIYPGIFLFCFTSNWRDWKNNLRRWALLLAANFAFLFILGWNVFLDFVRMLTKELGRPSYWWIGNHSIDSFLRVICEYTEKANPAFHNMLSANFQWFQIALLLGFLVCFGSVLWLTYHYQWNAGNPYLLLLATLGAMVIPSTSHDYKLCILIAPMTILFSQLKMPQSGRKLLDLTAVIMVIILTSAYCTTLFLHTDMPGFMANNFPALMLIAASATILYWISSQQNQPIKTEASPLK